MFVYNDFKRLEELIKEEKYDINFIETSNFCTHNIKCIDGKYNFMLKGVEKYGTHIETENILRNVFYCTQNNAIEKFTFIFETINIFVDDSKLE